MTIVVLVIEDQVGTVLVNSTRPNQLTDGSSSANSLLQNKNTPPVLRDNFLKKVAGKGKTVVLIGESLLNSGFDLTKALTRDEYEKVMDAFIKE